MDKILENKSSYLYLVLIAAWLGWVFDGMDAMLYNIVMFPAIHELLGASATKAEIGYFGGLVMSCTLLGAALGGILFGILADYIGRVKVLLLTILTYSLMTGLSGFAHSWQELAVYRGLTGFGIGGEWAVGAVLLAETWPDIKRTFAGSFMQMGWPVGFFLAAAINFLVGTHGWRIVFFVGAFPALLTLLLRVKLREPEKWVKDHARRCELKLSNKYETEEDKEYCHFTFNLLFSKKYIKFTIIGFLLSAVALFGVWGATYWIPAIVETLAKSSGVPESAIHGRVFLAITLLNVGAIIGALSFWPIANKFGRKGAFLLYFLTGLILIPPIYINAKDFNLFLLLVPVIGFIGNGVFSGFPVYLPELFPTKMRATAQTTCYNGARLITILSPLFTGLLIGFYHGNFSYAAATIMAVYVIGLITLIFAPETKGRTLPE